MAVDETSARFERLERQLQEVNDSLRRALDTRSNGGPSAAQADRSVQDILSNLDPDERRLIEDHRAYEQYKRLRLRRLEEEQRDALIRKAQSDDDDSDDDADGKTKPKPKRKPAKPKPASRHASDDDQDGDGDDDKKDDLPGDGSGDSDSKPEPWWRRD